MRPGCEVAAALLHGAAPPLSVPVMRPGLGRVAALLREAAPML